MIKDTYWFPHDYEPTSDPKMQAMLGDYGGLGYGIYWRVVEMLHSDSQHQLPFKKYIYSAIVKQMQPNAKQNKVLLNSSDLCIELIENFIKDCICDYELFSSNEEYFWSKRAVRNIEKKESISEERSIAGRKSAESRKNKANDEQKKTNVEQSSTITPHNITEEKKRRDNITSNTHRHYDTVDVLKNAAVSEIKNISDSYPNFSSINEKHVDYLSNKISEKYFEKQPIVNLRSLVLEFLERDKKVNKEEYLSKTSDSPI